MWKLRSKLFRFTLILFFLYWVAFLTGAFCNRLVVEANGGKMPVAINYEDRLFTIGFGAPPAPKVVAAQVERIDSAAHEPLGPKTAYALLADRIVLSPGFTRPTTGHSLWWSYFEQRNLYLERRALVSIGDLLIWLAIFAKEACMVLAVVVAARWVCRLSMSMVRRAS